MLPDQSLNVVLIEFNADSSLLALLCMSSDKNSMSILICVRSNWQWQVKQKIGPLDFTETKGVRALRWMNNKKQQLFYCDGKGVCCFTEFHFNYTTSLKSYNQKEKANLAYVCVVTDTVLNLTPLGKVVMPPPMSEKQVDLKSFPVHVDMFGHQIATLCENSDVYVLNCMEHEKVHCLKAIENGFSFKPCEVTKITLFQVSEEKPYKLAFILN